MSILLYQSGAPATLLAAVPPPTLESIDVSPSTASITAGNTQAFTATGTYSDASTADLTATATWSSDDTGVATVSAGTATGVAAGSCTITATSGAVSGTASLGVTAALISGTTADAVATGRASIAYVVAIEGYEYLLTNVDPAAAVLAWDGTDWTQALGGLFVQGAKSQQITPWESFQKDGGTYILRVQPDKNDTFGIDTHRRSAGAETYLTSTADRAATTLNVKDTSTFSSSGTVYCGTEAIDYTGTSSTSFTGCTRGKYSAFENGVGGRWAEHHRVSTDAQGVHLEPVVSEQPRVWLGRWVGIWQHLYDGTSLNAKADATLIFAGRIASIADDPNTGHTVVEVKSTQASVADASVGRDMWTAKVTDGITIFAGQTLTLMDTNYETAATWKTSNALTVVSSGASGANQINAGQYTLDELASFINSWLASERAGSRIHGSYNLTASYETSPGVFRSRMNYYIASTEPECLWKLDWPWGQQFGVLVNPWVPNVLPSNTWNHQDSFQAPVHNSLFHQMNNSFAAQCAVEGQAGTFIDQYSLFPPSVKQLVGARNGLNWGAFLYNESMLLAGSFSGSTISNIYPINTAILGSLFDLGTLLNTTLSPSDPLPTIRQVFLLEDTLANILKYVFYGSGATGHNNSTYDTLGYGLGIGIPGELLGDEFDNSVDSLPGADATIAIILDKSTKLVAMLGDDLVARLAFLRWKQGHLEFKTWVTPTADAAIATLDETNKAEPASNIVNQRSASIEDNTLVRDVIKLKYNRDFSATAEGEYHSIITVEDSVAVDDSGGEGQTATISARNTFPEFTSTGTGLESILPLFVASVPLFSRPKRKTTRSISLPYYEDITVGDVVLVYDNFARDPATGRRGIVARPATIVRHTCDYGGLDGSGSVRDMAGEVDLFFLDMNRVVPYVPCAQVDDTATNAGYDSTNHTLTVHAHAHSGPLESADAANFADGYDVLIVEIDPADPAAPISWTRSLTGVSGNVLTLDSALSSPAWDATKKYRVIFDHFTADETAQQAKAFQADGTTALIESDASPCQYGIQQGSGFVFNAGTEKAELHATVSYGDGKPRDVGYERGLARTLNALVDYRTNHCSPMLSNTILENTTYSSGNGYQLQAVCPIYLGGDKWSGSKTRYLKVAPWFRSSTGASATIRVSVCPSPTASSSKNDVTLPTPTVSATWTTTSTTWQTGTAAELDISFKPASSGLVWLHVECTIHCQTRLLAECQETKRK